MFEIDCLDFFKLFFCSLELLVFFKASQGPNPVGPEGGAPEGGAPEGGGPKGGGPEGWEPEISRFFFFPSPAKKFVLFFPLWVSSRGIVVVFEASGDSNVHVWSCLVVV